MSHGISAPDLTTDTTCIQECSDALVDELTPRANSAPNMWNTIRNAYRRVSMLPEPEPGDADGYRAILQKYMYLP